VASFQRAIEETPSPELYTNLAAAYLEQKELDRAQESLDLALKYDSRYPKAREARSHLRNLRKRQEP
jgi:Tfp pilus assembly protein PilF